MRNTLADLIEPRLLHLIASSRHAVSIKLFPAEIEMNFQCCVVKMKLIENTEGAKYILSLIAVSPYIGIKKAIEQARKKLSLGTNMLTEVGIVKLWKLSSKCRLSKFDSLCTFFP